MNILYEGVTHSGLTFMIAVIVTAVVVTIGLLWIFLSLTEEGEWTKGCTVWLVAILASVLIAVFEYDKAPEHRYIRVDVTSITDWDAVIKKYDVEKMTGKVLELKEKEPLEEQK